MRTIRKGLSAMVLFSAAAMSTGRNHLMNRGTLRARLIRLTTLIVLPASFVVVMASAPANAAKAVGDVSALVSCGAVPSTAHPQSGGFAANNVRIRTGPHTTCAILGLGYPSHSVTYYCFDIGDTVNGWSTWTY